jgi:hypothetical protein
MRARVRETGGATLQHTLEQRKDAIVGRWLDAALSAYPADGGAFFKRGRDRFANPVGHSVREGTRRLFDALIQGTTGPELDELLRDMLRIRAVQEMAPSTAVGFVLDLKTAVRAELGAPGEPSRETALAALDDRIDRLALAAFDIYVEFRDELARIRIREVQRKVSWIVDRLNGSER